MNSNETDNVCPDSPDIWPVGNWPQVNQTLSLLNFLLHACVSISSVGYMVLNRNESVYRSRNVVLMAISAVGIGLTVSYLSLREVIGRENWPCDATLWFAYLAIGMWMGPYTVQLLQLKNRLEWQDKLADMPMRLPKETSIADLVASKFKASHARAYIAMAAYMSVMIGITLGLAFSSPQSFAGCIGCYTEDRDFLVFSAVTFLVIFSIFIAFVHVPKRAVGQPQHPLVHQIRILFRNYLPLYLIYFLLVFLDFGDLHLKGIFSYTNLLSLVLTVLVFYTTAYPGLRAKRQARVSSTGLITVLRDPVLLELFEKHLKSEFSLENLRFYFEATALKRAFPTGKAVTQDARDEWRQRAFDVYNRFIATGALLPVNLSARVRHKIEQRLDISHAPAVGGMHKPEDSRSCWVESDIYDNAVNEVFRLMESDSYSRFAVANELALIDHELMMNEPQSITEVKSTAVELVKKASITAKLFLRKSPSEKVELLQPSSSYSSSSDDLPA